ncbi:GNAT family N-acetyltransferase [Aggregatilinea lenta]|uniref:GNAT family N-acetyltransferase n=1 Tax=Aggregatilinea lenta TaxID=913108 RepID=UPI0013C366B1|nr:GNAT family N-acetyltransferase [Aggregatilinea lenta]
MPHACLIRRMTEDDIPRLVEIRPGFVSETVLAVERSGDGIEVGWRLVERPLLAPFDKGHDYDFDATERKNIRERLQRGDGLHLVAERDHRLSGILDMLPQEWNSTAFIWNLMLDRDARGQGLGRDLFERAANWGRRLGYRSLTLETQTNNVPACRFYARMGCRLEGLRDAYYTNEDVQRGEVAIFWTYPLT